MPDHIEQVFAKAIDCHQNGRLTEAENLYRQVLAAAPRHLDSLNLLGVLAMQTGRSELAVELIGKAIELNDQVPDFHNNIGEAWRRLGRLDQAIVHFSKAASLEPTFVEAQQNLGDALSAQGRLDEAAGIYSNILRLKPHFAPAHRGLAGALRRQGRLGEAVNHLQQAVHFAPGSAEAHNDLGIALREQGRLDEAVAQFARALSIKGNFPEAHSNLGNALRERGQLDDAAVHLGKALQLKPNFPNAHHNLALVHLAAGRHEQALSLVLAGLKIHEGKEVKALFVRCLKQAPSRGAAPEVRVFLQRALSEPWGRPGELVTAAVQAITADLGVKQLMVRLAQHDLMAGGEAFEEPGLGALAGDELLRSLLQSAPIVDCGLERLLTSLRAGLLESSLDRPDGRWPAFAVEFFCALARQCFINEYVFALSDSQRERSNALCDMLGAALRAKKTAVPAE